MEARNKHARERFYGLLEERMAFLRCGSLRYAFLATALPLLLLLGSCAPKRVLRQPDLPASRPTVVPISPAPVQMPGPAPTPAEPEPAQQPATGAHRGRVVAERALQQLGRPYRWGGELPHRGFDCSGLVRWSYRHVGVDLPRVVGDQRRAGRAIAPWHLWPGDLVFFRIRGDRISHVGIYIGDGRFVHAPSSGQPVRTDSLNDPWWRDRWADARRILDP